MDLLERGVFQCLGWGILGGRWLGKRTFCYNKRITCVINKGTMNFLVLIAFGIIFVILFALSAFFSASETAMLSLSPLQIQRISERSPRLGTHLSKMLKKPEIMLSTLLIGNTFVNAALASIGLAFIVWGGWVPEQYTEVVSIFSVTLLVLLFGEISPKHFAIRHAESFAPHIVRVLTVIIPLLYPLSWCLQKLIQPFRKTLQPERRSITDEELVSVVNLSEEQAKIDREEGAMVRGILRLSELNASDVMTPRVDLIGLDKNDPVEKHLKLIRRTSLVWMPYWEDTPDNFIDFVDTARYQLDPKHDIEAARCNTTLAVPENIGLDDLLILLYRHDVPMVHVTDEYGGTAGIVSRGDILELLSLETDDATSIREVPDVRELAANVWAVAGDTSLEQLNFVLGTHLEADDADRISGWVTFHLGRLPKVGDRAEADGYRVTVQKMRKRKILEVLLEDRDPASQLRDRPPSECIEMTAEEDDDEEEAF